MMTLTDDQRMLQDSVAPFMAAGGSDALEWESDRSGGGKRPRDWLRTKANSIEGGTSEIQLGIVAKHILRLPGA